LRGFEDSFNHLLTFRSSLYAGAFCSGIVGCSGSVSPGERFIPEVRKVSSRRAEASLLQPRCQKCKLRYPTRARYGRYMSGMCTGRLGYHVPRVGGRHTGLGVPSSYIERASCLPHTPRVYPPWYPGYIPPQVHTHHGTRAAYTPCGIPTMGGIYTPLYTPRVYTPWEIHHCTHPGYTTMGGRHTTVHSRYTHPGRLPRCIYPPYTHPGRLPQGGYTAVIHRYSPREAIPLLITVIPGFGRGRLFLTVIPGLGER